MDTYIPVIGLEVHVELKTKRKMFCDCAADYFGKNPNTNTCPVCLGLPGALPVPNKKAVEWTILIGKALNCKINVVSKFDRKHYFYPDLPKGYQISQYDEPIAVKGHLKIKSQSSNLKMGIIRVHLEEDTGKLIHSGRDTLVDFNRSGVPLVEIVTEPDFTNASDVKAFLEELHTIIRYLDVSDANMEKGSMRIEPNISVKLETRNSKLETELPPYKVEVKNINSFRFVKQAIEYEVERQIEILEKSEIPAQETRGFDEKKVVTYSQRTKEEAHDYRYFPEPDIPPMAFPQTYIDSISVPQLPQDKLESYIKKGIKPQDALIITRDKHLVSKIDSVLQINVSEKISAKDIVNIVINRKEIAKLSPVKILKEVEKRKQPVETNEKELSKVVSKIIESNKKAVDEYMSGKTNAIMFLVGQVMREMKGKADAKVIMSKIKNQISK